MNKKPLHILFILAGLLLAACSAERNNPLSKTYHNTTARYNGYFLAKEKMRLLEEQLQEQTVYDYSQALPIFPPLDTATATALAADLEDIRKKASFPIQYHPNSKWVDNSYVLIGKANFYGLNFEEAVRTFKYVNANGKGKDERHEALVWLMRSFIVLGEMENAQQVSEYLRKERLNRGNARELYLTRAQYHRLQGDTAQVIENLALSLPNFEEKDAESRVRYTLGQLYQLAGQNKEANRQYSKVLRNNPPYDLGFFSRLNLGQVTELADHNDVQRIEGYYQKMLRDEKNKEYRNKIYYEMARFALRQQQYDQALEHLEQSLRTPGALPNQKAYSYVLAGEVYFENLNKYELAAAYYDSAVQVYPQQAAQYEAVAERRDILADFAQQYTTIHTQDSLQRIAKMPETERMAFLQQLAQREEEERAAMLARQQEQAQRQEQGNRRSQGRTNSDETFGTSNSGGVWYFDNPTAMTTARAEFTRRWGDRPNQDFWRTRTRGETGEQPAPVAQAPESIAEPEEEVSPEVRMQAQVDAYQQNLPLSTAALQQSERMVEEALFRLAVLYAQNLQEPQEAIVTYEQLLQRFPHTSHAAETYYSLYLLYGRAGNQEQQQAYYNKIKLQFPSTTYARLLDDEGFMAKTAADNIKVHAIYDSAYAHYEAQEYTLAQKQLNAIIAQYPFNDIQDKVMFLDAMIAARTEKPEVLRGKLNRFKQEHKGSPLVKQADKLLATYQDLEQKNQLRAEAPAPPKPKEKAPELTPEQKVSTEIAQVTASVARATPVLPPTATAQPATPEQPAAAAEETEQQEAAELPATAAGDTLADPAVDPMAYTAAADSAYYFVLIYPDGEKAFADIAQKYEKYNNMYYKKENLALDTLAFGGGRTMLVARAFQDPKLANAYHIKQKAPQAPVGRIRGVDFITFVISSANYEKFIQKKDPEVYLTFFKDNY